MAEKGRSATVRILAIETSCDETAAAVVENGRRLLSNVVASQIELHRRFGGVFPEVASRQHILAVQSVLRQALVEAAIAHVTELDAVAVTCGPGLAGSLLVGVNTAKGLSFASGLPLLPINHLEGHVYSNWIHIPGQTEGVAEDRFPVVVLIVSGGHTELILMENHCRYQRLGGTLDDAAGEAFDKVARLLGLGFPGGPAIQMAAQSGNANRFELPRGLLRNDAHRFDFSFSGLKTAALNLTRQLERDGATLNDPALIADLAASFQAAVVDVLVEKLAAAAQETKAAQVCLCGGVSANAALRFATQARMDELGLPLTVPPLFLCTDNAAMIGAAAFFRWRTNSWQTDDSLTVDVVPNLALSSSNASSN